MSTPGTHHAGDGTYRPPELIASIAFRDAMAREERCEREGQLYILGEILAALHRQAEALERINTQLDSISSSVYVPPGART